jgi:hypothetical protein
MDMMATPDDYEEQRRRLTNANLLTIVYQTYGHMDFVSRGHAGLTGLAHDAACPPEHHSILHLLLPHGLCE